MKKATPKKRSKLLLVVSSLFIIFGITMLWLAVITWTNPGPLFSSFVGLAGITTLSAGIASIVTNDPAWILLDLMIPS